MWPQQDKGGPATDQMLSILRALDTKDTQWSIVIDDNYLHITTR